MKTFQYGAMLKSCIVKIANPQYNLFFFLTFNLTLFALSSSIFSRILVFLYSSYANGSANDFA